MKVEQFPVKLVVIHDDLPENDPLLVELEIKYKKENVIFKKHSKEGLDYILRNVSQKTIIILDLNFKTGEPSGLEVFKEIRKKTSLIYIIMWTAHDVSSVNNQALIDFINNDALAFVSGASDYTTILSLVDKAIHQLDTRIDSAIEQWINAQPEANKEEPYILTKKGKVYNLKEILEEIRLQTDLGKEIEKKILRLTIDLLVRQKEHIDD